MLNNNILWISLLVILILLKLIDIGAERYKNILIKRKELEIEKNIEDLFNDMRNFYQINMYIILLKNYAVSDVALLRPEIYKFLERITELKNTKLLNRLEMKHIQISEKHLKEMLDFINNILKKYGMGDL